jgi:hypothetical protein
LIKVNGSRNGRLFSSSNDRNNRDRNVSDDGLNDRNYRNVRLYNSDIRLCNIMCYLENTWLLYRWRRRR